MLAALCGGVYSGYMTANALIDTGAILALLDRTDRWHHGCIDGFKRLRLPLLTSEAVLTELFHLVGDDRHQKDEAWAFVRSGAITLPAIENSDLRGDPIPDVALLGSSDGICRCNSRIFGEARSPFHYLHNRPRGFRNLPN